jgi:UTP--glucose-1-phosphate uridylyltransferase
MVRGYLIEECVIVQKVRKAVIPAAGLGTRVLPATKAMPKEMLPIVDKPAIQYIVEEAVAAGIEEILIITGRGKGIIEDHFDRAPELEAALHKPGKEAALDECLGIANLADIYYLRQKETKGLGHAILKARAFTGNEPFVVLYGDDVIMGEDPVAAQLCRAYQQYGRMCVGIKEVSADAISKYSSLQCTHLHDNLYNVTDMIEKPAPGHEFSLFSILGRCLLTPEIYDILAHTAPGAGGEIQLTDAMAVVARSEGMTGVDFTGKRYDMGAKLGVMEAQVETALRHPEIGEAFRAYLKDLCKTL